MSDDIVIYGGTFDPPTKAHAMLLSGLAERFKEVYVVPCKISPFKTKAGASAADRLQMLRYIADGMAGVHIDTFELDREGRDYTYITLQHFSEAFPGEFFQ